MVTIDQIKRCFLFFELLDTEIENVIKSCYVESFEDGELIFKEEDMGHDFFIILTGKVKLTKKIDGQEIEIMKLYKGDALGETALINESKRMTNVVAYGKVDLLVIDQDTIFSLFAKQPKIFGIIILNLSRMLTSRLQKSNETIAEIHKKFRKAI